MSASKVIADTSLTSTAPAATAAFATGALRVSMDRARPRRAAITGWTRSISTAAETSAAPGRVLSPPMSRMSARDIASACVRAASGCTKRPPSEKLSGVTFRMPMIDGRSIGMPHRGGRGAISGASSASGRSPTGTITGRRSRSQISTLSKRIQPPARRGGIWRDKLHRAECLREPPRQAGRVETVRSLGRIQHQP